AQHWLPIQPGTDIALLLAWTHVVINEKLFDQAYVDAYTTGFEALEEYIQPFTPEWAYTETGIDPEVIRRTARVMGKAAPATVIHPGRHTTWYGDDTQRSRAIAILNALLGSWGRKGGFYIPEKVALPKFPVPDYPQAKSSWRDFTHAKYPLAHHAVTNTMIDASRGEDAHYKAWFIYGTNLPMTIPGIREQLREAIDQQELVVVIDVQPAEITGYADIILPECSYLERHDPLRNSPERSPSLALREPAIEPLGDSKPGWWIAKQIGEHLGLSEYFPWNDYSEVLDWQLQQVGSSLEEMQKLGHKSFPRKSPLYYRQGEARQFRTQSGKIELYSHKLAENGFDPLPVFQRPESAPDGYYRLNYGRVAAHTFGRTQNNPLLYELAPENVVWINPLVATEYGIHSGDYVRLKNPEGITTNRVRARVTERIRPDSVYLPHGFGHTDKRLSLAYGKGADDSALMTRPGIDPIMGGTGMRTHFVTILTEDA
ncbi:MAG: molybdopterin-dependent oxidoreductase, partial [Gammaproteobacteria bacterium]|nr:molybdopterin-dependent oxidoreductase [Gammaproteobacteria bacterium]